MFNPEAFGIERIAKRRPTASQTSVPTITRSIDKDGKESIYARLPKKLTTAFTNEFGNYVGIGFYENNLMFYEEDDIQYACKICVKDDVAQIYIPTTCHDRLKNLYGNDFYKVKCKWMRHFFGGDTCFEFVGDEITYRQKVVA